MRWWLALLFAAIAALAALGVAAVFNSRAEHALRAEGRDVAVARSYTVERAIAAAPRGRRAQAIAREAARSSFAFWVFSPAGRLLTPASTRGTTLDLLPDARADVRSALAGRRVVRSLDGGAAYVVALRLRDGSGALVTRFDRPELQQQLGSVRDEIWRAALVAMLVAASAGLGLAIVISARLRRIAKAADAIESGAFDEPLRPRFYDELGLLADSFERMRIRLQVSFAEVEAQRDRLRLVLERLHEGVITVDHELRVVFCNSAARSLSEGAQLEPGAPLPELWRGFRLRSFAADLFRTATVVEARAGADDRVFALTGIPAQAGTTDAILVLNDVSEQERRERAEREFVTNAAHELGAPLAAIRASLEALQAGAKRNAAQRDSFLELLERQSSRLGRLRRALLVLARAQTQQEPVRLEAVDLPRLLESIAAESGPHDVEVAVAAEADAVALAHPELVEQIVFNLVDNAVRHARPTRIELAARRLEDGRVAIEVRDNGRGISGAEQERLFDRFYRGEAGGGDEGFGLGLAIVREAVRSVGGTIAIDSPAGGGTTVSIVLPAAEVAVA
jgi:signal transduction histidine kinase